MAYSIHNGISISVDGSTWYDLTDHNRQPIQYTPQRIEQSQRMANGSMRKYVIENKAVYDTSWQNVPTASKKIGSYSPTVDGKYGAGFMKAFYEKFLFQPVWIKLTYASDTYTGNSHLPSQLANPTTGNHQILKVFMTDFKYTVNKRLTLLDYVDVTMQFTEV